MLLYLDFTVANTTALVFHGFYDNAKLELGEHRVGFFKALGFSESDRHSNGGGPIRRMWQIAHSLFAGAVGRRMPLPFRLTVVALVANEQDRHVLTNAFDKEAMDVHFAESCEEACSVVNQLTAPVVLLDRDWPGTEWKVALERLGSAPHHACVILLSGVSDAYLWQELTRRGGYEVVSKPLQADKIARVVKLALSYWNSTPRPAVPAGSVRR